VINGVRDDNRPENLELWTRPQPSGIRVGDAITWAREIYDRYVGAGAPPTMLTVSPEHPWDDHESHDLLEHQFDYGTPTGSP
jgi:hypothetical protein